MVDSLTSAAAAGVIKAFAGKLTGSVLNLASDKLSAKNPYDDLRLDDYFVNTYKRCAYVKTIINGNEPSDLLQTYVSPSFSISSKKYDEHDFIDEIDKRKHVLIEGSAGSGKSIFMRYLWLSKSNIAISKIPVFVELRYFNDVKFNDVYSFLIDRIGAPVTDKNVANIREAAREGQFYFVFDALDEVSDKKKDILARFFQESAINGNIVVISTRQDLQAKAWSQFHLFRIEAFSKNQAILMIQRADFDPIIKDKFVKELNKKLYEHHKTFASRPLLLSMMLLTFDTYAEVPSRIHVFYEQAFDTLFSRHDATKEAFRRDRRTAFSIDQFKKILSYFCLLTYQTYSSENGSMTESAVLENLSRIPSLFDVAVDAQAFLHDLLNAVCILQRDGLNIVFSHRSFEEYFCAYAVIRLPGDQIHQLIKKFSRRAQDNVLSMLYDMNPELIKRVFFVPELDAYVKKNGAWSKRKNLDLTIFYKWLKVCGANVFIFTENNVIHSVTIYGSPGSIFSVFDFLRRNVEHLAQPRLISTQISYTDMDKLLDLGRPETEDVVIVIGFKGDVSAIRQFFSDKMRDQNFRAWKDGISKKGDDIVSALLRKREFVDLIFSIHKLATERRDGFKKEMSKMDRSIDSIVRGIR